MRIGTGPVFQYECLAQARRWRTYALRAGVVAALLLFMSMIAFGNEATSSNPSLEEFAWLGHRYFRNLINAEMAFILLAAPAATAGAICQDRANGTLDHMLTTDLSDTEIVLGKLAARLMPVLGLVACSWPVLAMATLLGGIDPVALAWAFAIILSTAVFGCSLALAFSVWGRKTHEVTLMAYSVFLLGIVAWPVWALIYAGGRTTPWDRWFLLGNPFYVATASSLDPGVLGLWDHLGFCGVALAASCLLVALAVWRMRLVARRGRAEKIVGPRPGLLGRIARVLPGPSLDRNPVLWREWRRIRPSRWMIALLAVFMGGSGFFCLVGAWAFWKFGADVNPNATLRTTGVVSMVFHTCFGLMVLALIAPTSMAEERQRGSLDVLAVTTLSTRSIVLGKWLGTFRLAALIAICPGAIALAMALAEVPASWLPSPAMPLALRWPGTLGGRIHEALLVVATILAHGAFITSIGLALAVWMKSQARAIAVSVGMLVVIGVVWPMVSTMVIRPSGPRDINYAGLSPAITIIGACEFFSSMARQSITEALFWGGFWAVEVLVLALGLLWLTIATFDDRVGRMPERPRRFSTLTIVTIVLAALIAGGSVVHALHVWIVGFNGDRFAFTGPSDYRALNFGTMTCALAVALGLVLAAAGAARALLPGRAGPPADHGDEERAPPARGEVWKQARRSFPLVLLLVVGPAVLGTALAAAPWTLRRMGQSWLTAAAVEANNYVWVYKHVPTVGEIALSGRWALAALLVLTVLVHGAAAIGGALWLAVLKARSPRAFGAVMALVVLASIGASIWMVWPFLGHRPTFGPWSFINAFCALLMPLLTRRDIELTVPPGNVLAWDAVIALGAAGALGWAARMARPGPNAERPSNGRRGGGRERRSK